MSDAKTPASVTTSSPLSMLLAMFQSVEVNEDAIPVLGDEDAMRVLAGWTKTEQSWIRPKRKLPPFAPTSTSHAIVWSWICEGWTIDVASVARAAGCTLRVATEKLDMLKTNRLIYPDGQMSKAARTALSVFVASKLTGGKKSKGGGGGGKKSKSGADDGDRDTN